jgi:hypothetical protein
MPALAGAASPNSAAANPAAMAVVIADFFMVILFLAVGR